MRRRVRKKKHLGEFSDFGFEVKFLLAQDVEDEQIDNLMDEFIDFVEKRKCYIGGGGYFDHSYVMYHCSTLPPGVKYRKDYIKQVMTETEAWLKARSEIVRVDLDREILDMWN